MENYRRKNKRKNIDEPVPAHRLKAISKIMIILFVCLTIRLSFIQFVQGAELKERASRQQTLNQIITPKRGTIYDANGKALAISAEVDTVTINPAKFKIEHEDEEVARIKTEENQKRVAEGLAGIFELNYDEVLAKVQSEKAIETIAKKQEKDKIDKLKQWMEDNEISAGINIDADSKRYYPYGNLASHVIGFTGTEGSGLYGIEHKWNETLKGSTR